MELMQAAHQWATRPDDEKFTSLIELDDFCASQKARSAARVVSSRKLTAVPTAGDHKALSIVGPNGGAVEVTNFSFGQLAGLAGAPAGYLRQLPGAMAADCINYGLHHQRDVEECGVLLTKSANAPTITARAVTGPNYGRIWNADVTGALVRTFGDGVTGRFKVPGEFGVQGLPVTKQSTTLYASDRDMWVFLADESNRIELPNRRNGRTGSLSRGFFAGNSDVGAGTFLFGTFFFDYMCGNHIIWGAKDYQEIKIRHTSGAPDRWIEQARPALIQYANSSAQGVTEALKAAQRKRIENVDAFLAARFTKSQVNGIKAAHMADEERPIETLWDAATGITAYARDLTYTNDRVVIEREAGKVLDLAA